MTTTSTVLKSGTLVAGADLRAFQHTAVQISAAQTLDAVTDAAERIFGILQNKPNTGEVCEVDIFGITKWKAGDAVAANAELMPDATGRCITAVETEGNCIYGRAVEAAGAANEIIAVLVPAVARLVPAPDT